MTKLKVGDKVKCLQSSYSCYGKSGVITKIATDYDGYPCYVVECEDQEFEFHRVFLEKQEDDMTKEPAHFFNGHDMSKNCVVFALLDEAYGQGAKDFFKGYKGEVHYFSASCRGFVGTDDPAWAYTAVYRLMPAPATKPSIDWSHVSKDFKWLAQDEDGVAYLYSEKPTKDGEEGRWTYEGGELREVSVFASFKPGTCDWEDSLVQRPDGV